MIAKHIFRPKASRYSSPYWAWACLIFLATVFAAAAGISPASDSDKARFAAHTEKAYLTAKTRFEADTNNIEAQWQFARACYDWADYATANAKREAIAKEGIAAVRLTVSNSPALPQGHYYLGMNIGQVAYTKRLSALGLITQMEAEFNTTAGLDADFDFAGADRNLGLLYLQAPGWPISIGNNTKARAHLQAALTRAPNYPENLLNFIEAEIGWDEKSGAERDLKTLDTLWPEAQKKFTGEDWASSWADWTQRRDAARKKIAPGKTLESPRGADH